MARQRRKQDRGIRMTWMRCGKTRYTFEKDALEDIRRATIAREKFGSTTACQVRAYQCPHCGGWHTTSQERS